jgi:hypothetical protein
MEHKRKLEELRKDRKFMEKNRRLLRREIEEREERVGKIMIEKIKIEEINRGWEKMVEEKKEKK